MSHGSTQTASRPNTAMSADTRLQQKPCQALPRSHPAPQLPAATPPHPTPLHFPHGSPHTTQCQLSPCYHFPAPNPAPAQHLVTCCPFTLAHQNTPVPTPPQHLPPGCWHGGVQPCSLGRPGQTHNPCGPRPLSSCYRLYTPDTHRQVTSLLQTPAAAAATSSLQPLHRQPAPILCKLPVTILQLATGLAASPACAPPLARLHKPGRQVAKQGPRQPTPAGLPSLTSQPAARLALYGRVRCRAHAQPGGAAQQVPLHSPPPLLLA
ncbi:hypothetical protein V8C86DRAFT_1320997 [Haematococcus lacustris]